MQYMPLYVPPLILEEVEKNNELNPLLHIYIADEEYSIELTKEDMQRFSDYSTCRSVLETDHYSCTISKLDVPFEKEEMRRCLELLKHMIHFGYLWLPLPHSLLHLFCSLLLELKAYSYFLTVVQILFQQMQNEENKEMYGDYISFLFRYCFSLTKECFFGIKEKKMHVFACVEWLQMHLYPASATFVVSLDKIIHLASQQCNIEQDQCLIQTKWQPQMLCVPLEKFHANLYFVSKEHLFLPEPVCESTFSTVKKWCQWDEFDLHTKEKNETWTLWMEQHFSLFLLHKEKYIGSYLIPIKNKTHKKLVQLCRIEFTFSNVTLEFLESIREKQCIPSLLERYKGEKIFLPAMNTDVYSFSY